MRTPLIASILVLAIAGQAQAEFVLSPSGPAPTAPMASAGEQISIPPRRVAPRLPLAQGFGDGVPLHVAARQIAPEGLQVVFGDGVDREMPVDWQGGRQWHLVLTDTLKTHGLKLVRTPGQVRIER